MKQHHLRKLHKLIRRIYPKEYYPLVNQSQLCKRLKLPLNVIKNLRDTNVLKWMSLGRSINFDNTSVEVFTQSFNVDDYFTKKYCVSQLVELGYYDIYDPLMRGLYKKLRFSITVKSLSNDVDNNLNGNTLKIVKFDKTEYISKVSMKNTVEYLQRIDDELNPPTTEEQMKIWEIQLKEKRDKKPKKMGVRRGGRIIIGRKR